MNFMNLFLKELEEFQSTFGKINYIREFRGTFPSTAIRTLVAAKKCYFRL